MNLEFDDLVRAPSSGGPAQVSMTLLDWFAGQALALLQSAAHFNWDTRRDEAPQLNAAALATYAYQVAQAMLAERARLRNDARKEA